MLAAQYTITLTFNCMLEADALYYCPQIAVMRDLEVLSLSGCVLGTYGMAHVMGAHFVLRATCHADTAQRDLG